MSEIQPVKSLPYHEAAQEKLQSLQGSISRLHGLADRIEGQDKAAKKPVDSPGPSYNPLQAFLGDLSNKLEGISHEVKEVTERIENSLF